MYAQKSREGHTDAVNSYPGGEMGQEREGNSPSTVVSFELSDFCTSYMYSCPEHFSSFSTLQTFFHDPLTGHPLIKHFTCVTSLIIPPNKVSVRSLLPHLTPEETEA